MKPLSLIAGFLPWIAFSLLSDRLAANGVAWSALIAVGITVLGMVLTRRRTPPKFLDVASVALFGVIAIVGFVGGRDVDNWLFVWGSPGVGVLLGLLILASVPVMPFTAQYARESTPREYWGSPVFVKINRVLSLAWGAAITVLGVCSVAVSAIDRAPTGRTNSGAVDRIADPQYLDLVLNWVVPIAVIWFMIRFTLHYPDKVTGSADTRSEDPVATESTRT